MDTKSPLFSILVITYNRHKMLKECLQSILSQTFGDYEVFVLDRGSEPSAEPIISELNDERFKYIRSSQDIHLIDSSNEIIKNINGKYFANLADDDVWAERALELVNLAFENNDDCDITQIGLVQYQAEDDYQPITNEEISSWSWQPFDSEEYIFKKYEGKNMACHTWMDSGIGEYKKYDICAYPHPTAIFLRKTAIDKVFEQQKGLFIKTFQDGGYHSIAYHTNIAYINIPLGIFSVNHSTRESNISRRRWTSEFAIFEHTPLKNIATFLNCSVDTSLKVIYRNKLDRQYKTYLRFDFFSRQFKEILKDKPKDFQTFRDLFVILPHLIISFLKHPVFAIRYLFEEKTKNIIIKVTKLIKNPKDFYNLVFEKPLNSIQKRFFKDTYTRKINELDCSNEDSYKFFNNILEFKAYLETRFNNRTTLLKEKMKNEIYTIKN